MLGFCRRRLQLLFPSRSHAASSLMHPHFTRLYSSKPLIGSTQDRKDGSFTDSYLVNTIGFSPEQAVTMTTASSWVNPEKADSVIKLLKDYGLTEPSILEIFKKSPILLSLNAETLLPKLEFFGSIGISNTVLARFLCMNPTILHYSLERSIRPCYDIIKSLPIPQEKVLICFKDMLWNKVKVLNNVASSILILRTHKVPDSSFHIWNPYCLSALALDSDRVEENFKRVMSMGIDPSCAVFMKALYAMSFTDATKWEQKMAFYRKWGWTEHDVLLAFRKCPLFICIAENYVSKKLKFFTNAMDCQPSDVAGSPIMLAYSLEKRIIPRCSVIRVLQSQGIIAKDDISLYTILKGKEKWFLETFVIRYQKRVPELLSIFRGKIGLAELG
ncbi:uncharacterized protein LOC126799636 [Argentina anserina]|uniref:uncharacterized protein LOC126799636 n=1 Tax=Argentina anserina TaxID=57926 RepID=UPI0021766641|nr:uncharacterized protein LOC126799636 [Potentilla anserina]